MFAQLEEINRRPKPFEVYTADDLWTDEYTSRQMLACHLNGEIDVSSRKFSFIDRSVGWIIPRFGIREGRSVADFGCGPGLYAQRLAATRAAITGIDFSGNSLKYAEARARDAHLPIRYVHRNYLEFDTDETYDLILMIFCDYCALSPEQRKILLVKFRNLLKPGGSILMDLYLMNAFHRKAESAAYAPGLMDNFWSPEKYYGFLTSFKYDDARVTLDKYTIVEKDRTRTIYNWLQYFDRESIAAELAGSGLMVGEYLANVAGDAFDAGGDEFAVVAHGRRE
ncbi:MAG: SAM-dependent methyltransferase [Chloroflexi bacterium RBG_13_60_9]|nr:MAG: SAM-dependent methyltransferase [Chloroflexi bacterium RBG_13_60_9]